MNQEDARSEIEETVPQADERKYSKKSSGARRRERTDDRELRRAARRRDSTLALDGLWKEDQAVADPEEAGQEG